MEAKHTPGPWRVQGTRIEYGPFVAGDGFVVAKVFRDPSETGTPNEWEANARLIAAAPDLLAACREAIDFIWAEMKENPDKEDMDGSIMDRLIELQTGLISVWRKARGGE